MHKAIIFVLLLTILGACGYTFYSMFAMQSQQTGISFLEMSAEADWLVLDDESNVNYVKPGVQLVYENENSVWFYLDDEPSSCPNLRHYNKADGQYKVTDIEACGIFSRHSEPLYIEFNRDGIIDPSLEHKGITAYDFDRDTRVTIFDTKDLLRPGESIIATCKNEGYEQQEPVCYATFHQRDRELIVSIYSSSNTHQNQAQPLEFENEKLREITIDLSEFY